MRFAATVLQLIALCAVSSLFTSQTVTVPARTSPVAVGEIAPDFTLADHKGQKVTLSEARTKSPVVLVFYRGYW
jgi:cytochrome oxidase Cu insertion factor (SCO1/SenC/PrrC family)